MFCTEVIGKRILELRKRKNMTQMELANIMGVSYQAVSNWERGMSLPDISKLPELAEIFECSIDCILGKGREVGLVQHVIKKDAGNYIREQEITKQEVLAVAPLLQPSQTEEALKIIIHSEQERSKLENKKQTEELKPKQTQEGSLPFQNSLNINTKWTDAFPVFENNSNIQWNPNAIQYSEGKAEIPLEKNKELEQMMYKLQQEEQKEEQQEIMSVEELIQIAPFVSQEFLEEILYKKLLQCPNLSLGSLAPFLSSTFLNEVIKIKLEQGIDNDLKQYLPFLEKETFLLLVETFIKNENFDQIAAFAPFLDDDILEQIVNYFIEQGYYENIIQYAPFLSNGILEQLTDQLYQLGKLEQIRNLALFLPEEKLQQMINEEINKGNFTSVTSIKQFYPFLSKKALESILRRLL